jgi:hypothetical protein
VSPALLGTAVSMLTRSPRNAQRVRPPWGDNHSVLHAPKDNMLMILGTLVA